MKRSREREPTAWCGDAVVVQLMCLLRGHFMQAVSAAPVREHPQDARVKVLLPRDCLVFFF